MTARARLHDLIDFVGWSTIRAICWLWLFGLIYLLLELAFAILLQQFLAALGLISAPSLQGRWFSLNLGLNRIIFIIFMVSFARAAVGFAQNVVAGGAMERFSYRTRSLLVENSLKASVVKTAETLTLFNERIYTAALAIQSVQTLVLQGVLILGLLISLFLISPFPTTLMFLVMIALLFPLRALNKRAKRSAMVHAETFSKIMLHLNNVFRNFLLIRLFNLQRSERIRILGHLRTYSDSINQYYRLDGMSGAVVPLFVVLNILWIAFVQNSTAAIDRRLAVPYLYLSFRFAQNLAPLVSNIARLAFASTQLRHTFRWWLEQRKETVESFDPVLRDEEARPVESAIGWRLRAVTFGYPDQSPLFNNFDLEVAPGSLVRVRGPSGVGKSTLVRLMVGEAIPHQGSVEVQFDGEFFSVDSAVARLREHIGYSSTEPYLFDGTIYENITYGLKALPSDRFLLDVAAIAECQFVFEFPRQFEHRIDELGQGLSTGQKQRLSLLRALLRKPRALILDEALSNVDMRTENRILANLIRIKPDCTVVFISHRDHSSLPSDYVLNLEEPL
jgi:ABC-type multidrug transport system fused ATPase/permease subunit